MTSSVEAHLLTSHGVLPCATARHTAHSLSKEAVHARLRGNWDGSLPGQDVGFRFILLAQRFKDPASDRSRAADAVGPALSKSPAIITTLIQDCCVTA